MMQLSSESNVSVNTAWWIVRNPRRPFSSWCLYSGVTQWLLNVIIFLRLMKRKTARHTCVEEKYSLFIMIREENGFIFLPQTSEGSGGSYIYVYIYFAAILFNPQAYLGNTYSFTDSSRENLDFYFKGFLVSLRKL